MENSKFVHVVYIRTTQEKLWDALREKKFTQQYWCETWQDTDWRKGSSWKLMTPDGRVGDEGEVLEFDPPRKFAVSWRHALHTDMQAEGHSRATFELEPMGDAVKLTVTHEIDKPKSKLIEAISQGWPPILSSLKSFLETGSSLSVTREWPKGM